MSPRYAARRDENERDIIDALKLAGWGVYQVDGRGFPDLVVSKGYRDHLIEVIAPAKDAKYRHSEIPGLTEVQVHFHKTWPGTIHIVRTIEEALAVIRGER